MADLGAAFSGATQGASAGSTFGPWGAVIGGGIGLLGGLFGSSSAKKAAEEQRRRMMQYAQGMQNIGNTLEGGYKDYGQSMLGFSEDARNAYQFTPYSIRNPFGTAGMVNGEYQASLAPEYQGIRDTMLGRGADLLGQASAFNTGDYQRNLFNQYQTMLQGGRQEQMQSAMRQLQAKGGLGLGGNVKGNMLMRGLSSAWGDQDQALAIQSQQAASREQDAALARAYGMLGQGIGIDQLAGNASKDFQMVGGMSQPFQLGGAGAWLSAQQQGLRSPLEGMLANAGYQKDALGIMAGADVNAIAARNAANQGMISGATNTLQNLPWGSMFGTKAAPSTNYGMLDSSSYTGWVGPW